MRLFLLTSTTRSNVLQFSYTLMHIAANVKRFSRNTQEKTP